MNIQAGRRAPGVLASIIAAAVAILAVHLYALPPNALGMGETATQLTTMLTSMRPDASQYVRKIRKVPRRRYPPTHYMALVRPGGTDPFQPADAPQAGRKQRNDILFYADSFGLERSTAWRLILLDHEYAHAKHLSERLGSPLVTFGSPAVDRHYFEAIAWGHSLQEAARGSYGTLHRRDWTEMRGNFKRHLKALKRFIDRRQPTAWLYYSGFFPDPESGGDSPSE
ncbi:MAG: hypothetical protein O6947_03130, partial [Acidobacteria bacterium]|nr:hypothetical protein [Acidobacteriota bacterium]